MITSRARRQSMLRARTSPLWTRWSPGPRGGAHRADAALVAGTKAGTASMAVAKAARVVVRKGRFRLRIGRLFRSLEYVPESVSAASAGGLSAPARPELPGGRAHFCAVSQPDSDMAVTPRHPRSSWRCGFSIIFAANEAEDRDGGRSEISAPVASPGLHGTRAGASALRRTLELASFPPTGVKRRAPLNPSGSEGPARMRHSLAARRSYESPGGKAEMGHRVRAKSPSCYGVSLWCAR